MVIATSTLLVNSMLWFLLLIQEFFRIRNANFLSRDINPVVPADHRRRLRVLGSEFLIRQKVSVGSTYNTRVAPLRHPLAGFYLFQSPRRSSISRLYSYHCLGRLVCIWEVTILASLNSHFFLSKDFDSSTSFWDSSTSFLDRTAYRL